MHNVIKAATALALAATGAVAVTGTAGATTHPVGSSQMVTTTKGITYAVRLTHVIDPARGGTSTLDVPNPGTRFVATDFTITDRSVAVSTGDANHDARVVGSNGHVYSADDATVAECADFDHGVFRLTDGQSVAGCVSFEMPNAVTPERVEWATAPGAGHFVQWTVPAPPKNNAQLLDEWAARYSSDLAALTNGVIDVVKAKTCADIYTAANNAKTLPNPPEDAAQWRVAVVDFALAGRYCLEGIDTSTRLRDSLDTFLHFLEYLITHGVPAGQVLLTRLETALG